MYDPDAHRYDSWLGNPPMMQPLTDITKELDWKPLPPGWDRRCFMPCVDQLQGRTCPCLERQREEANRYEIDCPRP